MSKKIAAMAAVVVLIAALVVVLRFVQNMEDPVQQESSHPAFESIYVLGEAGADNPLAVTVEVQNEKGSYTIVNEKPDEVKKATNYIIKGFEGISLSGYQVTGVADRATALVASTVVAADAAAQNLADYGLDKPSATLNITYADNSKAKLTLGARAPGDSGMYAMREGDPAIYLLYQNSADYFLFGVFDMIDKTITTGDPMETTFKKAVLGGSLRPEEIVVEETPQLEYKDVMGGISFSTHNITAPTKNNLHTVRGYQPLLDSFGLQAAEIVAKLENDSGLAAWGLSEPYSTLQLTCDPEVIESFRLIASEPDSEGNVYLVREGRPLVYKLPASSLPWLTLTTFDMMEKMLITPFIDNLSTLEVKTPEKTVTISFSGKEDELKAFIDGVEYEDMRNLRTFYQTLMFASYDSYTEDTPPSGAPLLLQYTYNFTDGKTKNVVSFYQGSSRRVFVQLDDNSPMYALSAYVDRVIADLDKLLAGEKIAAYI